MIRRSIVVATMTLFGLVFWPSIGVSQQKSLKEQLVGTWIIVSVDNVRDDGGKAELFGPNPKGILIYTNDGHFVLVNMRGYLPKFAAKNRDQGTPEENKAVVQGSIAYFGTWMVNEADKVITAKIEGSTYPNFVGGPDQKRLITSLTADELKFINPAASAGGKLQLVWKRVK
ncbi:MAG TPA: lipocalin-like domain-containing protein [Pseudolabrys sp.]|nr:lipocalin-like domain-containing protein [Pseudolabrys sp.]